MDENNTQIDNNNENIQPAIKPVKKRTTEDLPGLIEEIPIGFIPPDPPSTS